MSYKTSPISNSVVNAVESPYTVVSISLNWICPDKGVGPSGTALE